jgi:hypothetical protein
MVENIEGVDQIFWPNPWGGGSMLFWQNYNKVLYFGLIAFLLSGVSP